MGSFDSRIIAQRIEETDKLTEKYIEELKNLSQSLYEIYYGDEENGKHITAATEESG